MITYIKRLLLSCVLSIFCWLVINNLIVEVSFLRYLFIEILLLLSFSFYKFAIARTNYLPNINE
jgi:hypothetical protein